MDFLIGLEVFRVLGGVYYVECMVSGCANSGLKLSTSSNSFIILYNLMVCKYHYEIESARAYLVELCSCMS
jgi:hypothetical protein